MFHIQPQAIQIGPMWLESMFQTFFSEGGNQLIFDSYELSLAPGEHTLGACGLWHIPYS